MVKVIDKGPDPSVVKTILCKFCGAKLEYVPYDITRYDGTDMGGGPDGKEWIVCPNCKKDVIIRSW